MKAVISIFIWKAVWLHQWISHLSAFPLYHIHMTSTIHKQLPPSLFEQYQLLKSEFLRTHQTSEMCHDPERWDGGFWEQ